MAFKECVKEDILECVNDFKQFLTNPLNKLEVFDFSQKLPELIIKLTTLAETFCIKKKVSRKQHFSVIVYLMQYCSVYKLFKNVYTDHSIEKEAIIEIQRCLCKQLMLLLDGIDGIFDNDGDVTVGSFLNLVDAALDKIQEIDISQGKELVNFKLNALSNVIEEILCLSMSVAQIAFGDDNKIVTAGCRSMLNAIESLKIESNQEKPNIAMCNLLIDTCSDTLCALETKVNTAVLRLCLTVFSEHTNQIGNLYSCCVLLDKPDNNMLNPLIMDFDLHMDRIFQIGLFSVASSTIGQRVADIKNILANLEFLEGELVPSFIAMTNDQLQHRKVFADALKTFWSIQLKLLRKTVHCIIEPSAYSKLVHDELKQKVDELWQHISLGNNVTRPMVDLFIDYTKELGHMFRECFNSFDSIIQNSITIQLKMVHKVLNELIATRDVLLTANSNELNETTNKRIFKRCQALVVTIKRLWLCTIESSQENQHQTPSANGNIQNQTIVKSNPVTENVSANNQLMQSIIMKSKQMLKDRSICHLNQTTLAVTTRLLKENSILPPNENLIRLRKTAAVREHSYRQKTFVEGYEDISIMKDVLSHIEK